jgi:hypothetical protein
VAGVGGHGRRAVPGSGVLGAEAGDRVGEAGSRGRAGLDGGERRGWRSGPASRAGLREGAGPASRAGVGWRRLRRVSGRAHGAATRRRATAVDSSEKRKREEEKKGGEPLEMRRILHVGPTYGTVHFTVAGGGDSPCYCLSAGFFN